MYKRQYLIALMSEDNNLVLILVILVEEYLCRYEALSMSHIVSPVNLWYYCMHALTTQHTEHVC